MITEVEKKSSAPARLTTPSGWLSIVGGVLYNARWIWELSEGRVKHMGYPPTPATQYFFLVQLLFLVVLISLYRHFRDVRTIRYGLLIASVGLVWDSLIRLLESIELSAPWDLYSYPGLAAFLTGTLVTGLALNRIPPVRSQGVMLLWIGVLHTLAGLASVLLYYQLGGGLAANQISSLASNFLLIAEGMGWIYLGIFLVRGYKPLQHTKL
ncbi:hypothetical protein [Telluribacter sp. SYSU D00476]|uniref:hypothetical protein n=1 Tax=Telluribacter sp. SYSU D00476 TaxID=2811430 RepID=UPI001FF6E819|nr:hypothetical protein [Telluribacter sp. SYSU D00476]